MKFRLEPLEDRIVFDGAIAHDVAAAPAPAPANAEHSNTEAANNRVLIISDNLHDSALLKQAAKDQKTIVVSYDNSTTLQDLSNKLNVALGGEKAVSIGFITEGSAGQFDLVNHVRVNSATIDASPANRDMINFWQNVTSNLIPSGTIDILGCNVAAGAQGSQFLHDFGTMIGNNFTVEASTHLIGSTSFGGNWVLDASTKAGAAPVDAGALYFANDQHLAWNHYLAPGINVSPIVGLNTTGTGGTDSFSIVLNDAPTDNVSIAISSSDIGQGTVSTSLLTFTTLDWMNPQIVTITGVNDGIAHAVGYTIITGAASSLDPLYNGIDPDDVSVTNTSVEPTISIDSVTHNEGSSGTTAYDFTVSLDYISSLSITVSYTTNDGSATLADNDYIATTNTITFLPGETSHIVTVNANGDTKFETNETFSVDLSAPTNATIASGTGTGTILNDDSAPTVTIANASGAEGATGTNNPLTFTATLSNPSFEDITVHYTTSNGTAIAGTDYVAGTGDVIILAGTTQATFNVLFIGDNTIEPNDTFNVTGTITAGTTTNPTAAAVGTILNDDISFSITNVQHAEGNSGTTAFTFTVTLSGTPANNMAINYTTNDTVGPNGTIAGTDYIAQSGTLNFTTLGPLSQNITIFGIGNTIVELTKLFTVDLTTTAANLDVAASTVQGVGTILNDDTTNITIANVTHAEGTGEDAFTMDFTVTISNPIAFNVTVNYSTADGTALISDSDYTAASGTLTFTPGGPMTQIISVPLIADSKLEQNENFVVNLSGASAGAAITQSQGVGTITNDDGIQISISNASQNEGNAGTSAMAFTVSLSAATDIPIQVNYQTFDGTVAGLNALVSNSDYFATSGTLTFLPGGSLTQTVNVTIIGDLVVELNENFTVQLSNPVNAVLNPNATIGTGTIVNDDVGGSTTVITTVWRDLNGNGLRDVGENGMKDVTVKIYQSSVPGTAVATTTTDASGQATFANLTPGTYFLTWDIIPGHSITLANVAGGLIAANDSDAVPALSTPTVAKSSNFTLVANTFNSNVSAGFIYYNAAQGGQVGDFVFNDLNHNGIQDPGELGIPGVTVTLFGTATVGGVNLTVPLISTTTDATGHYLFSGLAPTSSLITGNSPDVVFVIDRSGSTNSSFSGSSVGDINHDNRYNTTLDAELASFRVLVNDLISQGFGNIARVSLITFSDNGTIVNLLTLNGGASSIFATPNQWADGNGNFLPAAQSIINTVIANGGTNYQAALNSAINVFNSLGTVGNNGNMIFLSDGQPTGPPYTTQANELRITRGYTVTAIGVGNGATLPPLQIIDPAAFKVTNTDDLLNFFDGTFQSSEYILHNYYVKFDLPTDRIFSPQYTTSAALDSNANPTTGYTDTFSLNTNEHNLTIDAGMTQVLVSIDNVSHNEGNSGTTVYTFTASLNFAQTSTVVVQYQTNDGTATTADSDYVSKTGTLIFNPSVTTQTFTVNVNGDLKYENNEQFTVTLFSAINAAVSTAPNQGVGTIVNDDNAPTVTIIDTDGGITPGAASIVEGNSGTSLLTFTIQLSNPSFQDTVFAFFTTDGTAMVSDNDYAQVNNGVIQVTILANTTETIFNIVVNGDTKFETDETLTATLSVLSGTVSNPGALIATGTILNDDSAPTFTINPTSVLEGNSGNTAMTFTIQLSNTSYQDITFTYSTTDGTALTSDNDYIGQTNATMTILSGATQGDIVVQVNGDTKFETDETLTINPTVTSGIVSGAATQTVTGTILNDDTMPTISFGNNDGGATAGSASILEGNIGDFPSMQFKVQLSNASYQDITFTYSTADGTATIADSDYTAVPLTTVTILAGDTTVFFNVQVIGDIKYELNETLTVNANVTSANVTGSTAFVGTGTIINDDAMPTITFTNNDGGATAGSASVIEGNSGVTLMSFKITLSNPNYQDITFTYSTADGTALISDNDYAATSGTATILAGQTEVIITIAVIGDTKFETNETFTVQSNVTTANVAGSTAFTGTGTILNDDSPPTIDLTDITGGILKIVEGNSGLTPVELHIRLSNATYQDLTFSITTADGIAFPAATLADLDYVEAKGAPTHTVTLLSGATEGIVTIFIVGDTKFEPDESFSAAINITGVPTLTGTASFDRTIIIINDDAYPFVQPNSTPTVIPPTYRGYDTGNNHITQNQWTPYTSTNTGYEPLMDFLPDIIVTEFNLGASGAEHLFTGEFKVFLTAQPKAAVTIELKGFNLPDSAISPKTLTFTPENWREAQTISVEEKLTTIDPSVKQKIVTQPAKSADPYYDGYKASDVDLIIPLKKENGIESAPAGEVEAGTEQVMVEYYSKL